MSLRLPYHLPYRLRFAGHSYIREGTANAWMGTPVKLARDIPRGVTGCTCTTAVPADDCPFHSKWSEMSVDGIHIPGHPTGTADHDGDEEPVVIRGDRCDCTHRHLRAGSAGDPGDPYNHDENCGALQGACGRLARNGTSGDYTKFSACYLRAGHRGKCRPTIDG